MTHEIPGTPGTPPPGIGAAGRPPLRRGLLALWLAVTVAGAAVAIGALTHSRGHWTRVTVPSGNMLPTYQVGAQVTFEKAAGSDVHRGDVVMLAEPEWQRPDLHIMRVIGVGGDHVELPAGGPLRVNGQQVAEPYLYQGESNLLAPVDITVPPGRLFLLGDHRADSIDSRMHLEAQSGTLAASDVRGKASKRSSVAAYGGAALAGIVVALVGAALALTTFLSSRRTNRPPAWGPATPLPGPPAG
jgi:signal peptidase I